jgi:hypothetical protein
LASSPPSRLTALQQDLLREIFTRDQRFFLTGGAALAGYYLHHRETEDIDLFSMVPLDLGVAARGVEAACESIGAIWTRIHAFPDFVRIKASRGAATCEIDLVVDRAPALDPVKPVVDNIRVDTLREMTANKLCTVFSRAEPRDLVDLMMLLRGTNDIAAAIRDAESKDAGFNPADLAKLLADIVIPEAAVLPGGVSAQDLEAFRKKFIEQLQSIAFKEATS